MGNDLSSYGKKLRHEAMKPEPWDGMENGFEGDESSGSLSQGSLSPCPVMLFRNDSQLKPHFSNTGTRHQVAVDCKSPSRKAQGTAPLAPLFPVHRASFHLVSANKHSLIYNILWPPGDLSDNSPELLGAHNLTRASSR